MISPQTPSSQPATKITLVAQARVPTEQGTFTMKLFKEEPSGLEHVAMVMGDVAGTALVRVHSECMTGDVFGSLRCDCGPQLHFALRQIGDEGRGAVLYLRQEGRGIGLTNKIRAYHLQSRGYDTVDANRMLGLPDDARSYEVVPEMLAHFGVPSISLMTNNPDKVAKLAALGVKVDKRRPVITVPNQHSVGYFEAKRTRMGHALPQSMAISE